MGAALAPLLQGDCALNDNNLWRVTVNPDNTYFITSKVGNFVFDNLGFNTNNGNPILGYNFLGGDNQKWQITSYGQPDVWKFTNKQSQKCFDVDGTIKANTPHQWDCMNGNVNQGWQLFEIPQTASPLPVNKFIGIRNMITKKCIQMGAKNTQLLQGDCALNDNNLWKVTVNPDNTYIITSKVGNFVFDNSKSDKNNGNPQLGNELLGGDNQKWQITPYSPDVWRFTNKQSQKCLDHNISHQGVPLLQWDCMDVNLNQGWELFELPAFPHVNQFLGIRNMSTQKCIQMGDSNTKLLQGDCASNDNNLWRVTVNPDNTYIITSKVKISQALQSQILIAEKDLTELRKRIGDLNSANGQKNGLIAELKASNEELNKQKKANKIDSESFKKDQEANQNDFVSVLALLRIEVFSDSTKVDNAKSALLDKSNLKECVNQLNSILP